MKGELLEKNEGSEGLCKELRVLPYLPGIRGDAPDEKGMAPGKQKEEPWITLLSVLTLEDFTLLGANSISHPLSLAVRSCKDCWNLDTSVEA